MASFEDLYSPMRFQGRVLGKTVVGIANTGIDVTNLFRDLDDQFKPIDLDEDVFNQTIQAVANKVGDVTNPDRGRQAQDILKSATRAPESSFGEFSEDAATFLLGFLGGRKLITAGVSSVAKGAATARAGKLAIELTAGAGSAFTLEDPEASRLVNFIPKEHRPAFIDYLAYDPDGDETRIEGRFKNALVDMGLGVMADGAFGLVAKTFKHLRRGIHLEAAGDPEMAAKMAGDALGMGDIPTKAPSPTLSVDVSTPSFEGTKSIATPKGASKVAKDAPTKPKFTPKDEAEAVEAMLKIGPKPDEDDADFLIRTMNMTHFDLDDEDATAYTAQLILEKIGKYLSGKDIETWGDVLRKSNKIAGNTSLDSFEKLAKLTGDTVRDVERANPTTYLIRRLYVESGEEVQKLKSLFLQADKKKQGPLRDQLRKRLPTLMMLTGGVSELGTAFGRGLRAFGAPAKGDLGVFTDPLTGIKQAKPKPKGVGKGKPRSTTNPKPIDPKDAVKKAQDKLEGLTKELDKLRGRFGDDVKLPKGKRKASTDTPEIKDLKERIKFYKGAESDANQLIKLEGKLEALKALDARGTKLDLEAGTGKLDMPKGVIAPEQAKLLKEIAELKTSMQKKLDVMDPPAGASLEERVEAALAEQSPEGVARAVKEASDHELDQLILALKSVDMADAKAWIKSQQQESGGFLKALQTFRKIKMMNILSGIPTFTMNTTGNTASVLFRAGFEDLIAGMVPSRNADRMTLFGEARAMRSLLEQPLALTGEVFKGVSQAIRNGDSVGEVFTKLAVDDVSVLQTEHIAMDTLINSNSSGARLINGLGRIAHALSFGHMSVTDSGFKQMAFAKEAVAMADTKGAFKGLKGRELIDYKHEMLQQSIFLARKGKAGARHILADLKAKGVPMEDAVRHLNDVSDMVNESRRYAKEGVFQDEISSETLKWIESGLNKNNAGTHLFKTLVIPFFRTPVKIVEFAWERTPLLNLTSRKLRADLKGINGTRSQQRAVAKFITGSTMYMGAMHLAQSNLITGKHRPEERDALIADGVPEYSIRAPHTDKWISFQRADPFAMFLGITADLNKLVEADKLDGGTAAAAMMNALSSNVLNKTFMKGLSDSLKAANSPSEFGAYYTDSQVRAVISPISSFQRSFEKVWNANSEEYRKQKPDPSFSELRDWVDIMFGESGLTDTREYDMSDALGNKIKRGPLWSELSGLRATETDTSPSLRQLALHKRFPKNRELSLATGFKMNQKEFLDFKQILGSPDVNLRKRMDRLVLTSAYRRASSEKQVNMLDKIIRDSRKLAKSTLLKRDPSLKAKVVEHKRSKLIESLRTAEDSLGIPSIEALLTTRRQTLEREE